jgi:hypothetical protein
VVVAGHAWPWKPRKQKSHSTTDTTLDAELRRAPRFYLSTYTVILSALVQRGFRGGLGRASTSVRTRAGTNRPVLTPPLTKHADRACAGEQLTLHAGFISVKGDGLVASRAKARAAGAPLLLRPETAQMLAPWALGKAGVAGVVDTVPSSRLPVHELCVSVRPRTDLPPLRPASRPPGLKGAAGAGPTVIPHAPSGSAGGGCTQRYETRAVQVAVARLRPGRSLKTGPVRRQQRAHQVAWLEEEEEPQLAPRLVPAHATRRLRANALHVRWLGTVFLYPRSISIPALNLRRTFFKKLYRS